MPRYIFIDNASGYIWGDAAEIGGHAVDGDPIAVARAIEAVERNCEYVTTIRVGEGRA